ncbi:MAG: hypothetical protein Ct9H300mP27_11280 [Chloroflexota bacterium]|nr:MAG: hypothetical protein Ct9H300mP27_11280 [Chloroflexota bacterium]
MLDPNDPDYYFGRADLYTQLGRHYDAIPDYDKAIALVPTEPSYYVARGHSNVEMEEYPAAISDFGKAIELSPDDGSNYRYRGEVYAQLGQPTTQMPILKWKDALTDNLRLRSIEI